ncbi:hypothetical protein TNCT_454951 [Trichonephila clavata]|uniref:Uncharacterized protein n=1 Tax=Trichonephila clavata TaxID=2740835 RepID=A0A8X6J1X5_TRICU|nr:hypothetical protein TNCT_454951 [Trichonephila clavata]
MEIDYKSGAGRIVRCNVDHLLAECRGPINVNGMTAEIRTLRSTTVNHPTFGDNRNGEKARSMATACPNRRAMFIVLGDL